MNSITSAIQVMIWSLQDRITRDEAGLSTFVEVVILLGVVLVIAVVLITLGPLIASKFSTAKNTINGLP